jgi:hypothetical protein
VEPEAAGAPKPPNPTQYIKAEIKTLGLVQMFDIHIQVGGKRAKVDDTNSQQVSSTYRRWLELQMQVLRKMHQMRSLC